MTDEELVQRTALDYIRMYGRDAVPRLLERAEAAVFIGDVLSAEAWQDIADAVLRLTTPSAEAANAAVHRIRDARARTHRA